MAGLLLFGAACNAGRPERSAGRWPDVARTSEASSASSSARDSGRAGHNAKAAATLPRDIRPAPRATLALPTLQPPPALTPVFHRGRREALRQRLPAHSVAVLFAAPPRLLAADVDYPFHQDPDFYYLTGLREPGAVLLLFADPQPNPAAGGPPITEQLYVQPRDPFYEQWNGARLGPEGAARTLGFGRVLPTAEFVRHPPNLARFEHVCWLLPRPGENGRDTPEDSTELADLARVFYQKAIVPANFNPLRERLYAQIRRPRRQPEKFRVMLASLVKTTPALQRDAPLLTYLNARDSVAREAAIRAFPPPGRLDVTTLDEVLNELREIKQSEELALLRYAIAVSVTGHRETLKAIAPDQSEADLDGIQQHVFRHYRCRADGYWPIVGAGANGCVLHYEANEKARVGAEMVVMDVGAAYGGYTADVTRTAPGSGRFSLEQRAIYELVLKAQEAGIAASRAGNDFFQPGKEAQKIIAAGLIQLGLITAPDSVARYFPHGTSHYLGLDVHDRGLYGPLRAGSVITVEPGIYIPPNSPCDPKWWGIGCRIEDDILITSGKPENLSAGVPRAVAEVEALIAEPSGLDGWIR